MLAKNCFRSLLGFERTYYGSSPVMAKLLFFFLSIIQLPCSIAHFCIVSCIAIHKVADSFSSINVSELYRAFLFGFLGFWKLAAVKELSFSMQIRTFQFSKRFCLGRDGSYFLIIFIWGWLIIFLIDVGSCMIFESWKRVMWRLFLGMNA